jgi:ferritin
MVQTIAYITLMILIISKTQSAEEQLKLVRKCLSELVTQEFSGSYNYLQLSSKSGSTNAYPGFSSLFIKLSDDDSSKAYDLVEFLVLRKFKLHRLIHSGVDIRKEVQKEGDIYYDLKEARNQNKEAWKIAERCHKTAINATDANVQDYLETHILDHHIEVEKLLSDFENRLNDSSIGDKKLITFMLDEELLNTYGDRRKDIFS